VAADAAGATADAVSPAKSIEALARRATARRCRHVREDLPRRLPWRTDLTAVLRMGPGKLAGFMGVSLLGRLGN
jgi:hypothetical protein